MSIEDIHKLLGRSPVDVTKWKKELEDEKVKWERIKEKLRKITQETKEIFATECDGYSGENKETQLQSQKSQQPGALTELSSNKDSVSKEDDERRSKCESSPCGLGPGKEIQETNLESPERGTEERTETEKEEQGCEECEECERNRKEEEKETYGCILC
jgi:hypothetical protein